MLSLKTKKLFTYIFLFKFFYDYYIYYITFQMANESSPLRLPNESNIEGSKRRIRTRRNWHGQLTMMNSITREAGEQMQAPENRQYHDAFQGINGGRRWPHSEVTSCIEFNADLCARGFFHDTHSTKDKKNINVLHLCFLCLKLYSLGAYHQITDCPVLKHLDKNEAMKRAAAIAASASNASKASKASEPTASSSAASQPPPPVCYILYPKYITLLINLYISRTTMMIHWTQRGFSNKMMMNEP